VPTFVIPFDYGSGTVINYGSGSAKARNLITVPAPFRYGKVMVPSVPVPQPCLSVTNLTPPPLAPQCTVGENPLGGADPLSSQKMAKGTAAGGGGAIPPPAGAAEPLSSSQKMVKGWADTEAAAGTAPSSSGSRQHVC
jgi:hypothetical protein